MGRVDGGVATRLAAGGYFLLTVRRLLRVGADQRGERVSFWSLHRLIDFSRGGHAIRIDSSSPAWNRRTSWNLSSKICCHDDTFACAALVAQLTPPAEDGLRRARRSPKHAASRKLSSPVRRMRLLSPPRGEKTAR